MYTGEAGNGRRMQRWILKGTRPASSVKPPIAVKERHHVAPQSPTGPSSAHFAEAGPAIRSIAAAMGMSAISSGKGPRGRLPRSARVTAAIAPRLGKG